MPGTLTETQQAQNACDVAVLVLKRQAEHTVVGRVTVFFRVLIERFDRKIWHAFVDNGI